MTKVALALFATVVWTAHLDADEPLTGPTLGTRTPNIADMHPDLHQILTGGTFDAMRFEQKIMFLHEPYDLPQMMEQITANACAQYDLLVGIEEVLAKGRVALP